MMEVVATMMGLVSLAAGVAITARARSPRPTQAPKIPPGWLPVLNAQALIRHTGAGTLISSIRSKTGLAPGNYERDYGLTITRFMEFTQLLPASESHHHAHPGGLAVHALETADIALSLRRSQVLPPGVPPEDIQRREHRWTYGVFLAAMIHDLGKPLADLNITLAKDRGEGAWSPLAGSMAECGGLRYRVEFALSGTRNYQSHQRLAIFLLQRIVPQPTLAWLSEDAELLAQLTAFLSGEDTSNSIAKIAVQADRESVRRNLLDGPRTRFATARAVPLYERLMEALQRMLAEGAYLPLNRPGAAGFVADDSIWFVSKRLADEVREYLAAHESAQGVPGPEKNDRLFDVWQEYGVLIPNPETGGAVWRARVTSEGFDQLLTLLRFPLDRLYPSEDRYPAAFPGQVTPQQGQPEEATASLGPDHAKPSAEESVNASRAVRTADDAQVVDNPPAGTLPPMTIGLAAEAAPGPDEAAPADEFLEEEEYAQQVMPRPPTAGRIAPMRLPDKPPKTQAPPGPKEPSAAAMRFMAWLQQGLASGTIASNETGAMVHFVPEGMFLASPRIFRHFAERFGESGDGAPSGLSGDKLGTGIQREVIRAGWHLLGPKKTNVHKYQVMRRNGQGGSLLSGMVIPKPERFIEPVPPANPHLVRSDIEIETKSKEA